MRKVVVSEFVTLDGIMEAPDKWSFPFWTDEIGKMKLDELFASDALLLGRVTYQGFAAAWPKMTDDAGFADRMNGLPKFVASTTLKDLTWNNARPIEGDVAEEVARLKQQPGQNILVGGSRDLITTLAEHDLVDEYQLLIYPIVVGSGKRLFADGSTMKLKLVETKSFSSGVVLLSYVPARSEGERAASG